jgi:hypothetical protein
MKDNNGGNGNDITMTVITSKIIMEIEMVMIINYF